MPDIEFPDENGSGLDDLPVVVMVRDAAGKALGRPDGFRSPAEVVRHLARWLRAPECIEVALAMPIAELSGDEEDVGTVGDMVIDEPLVDILRAMDVDPRAFCVLAAIHSIATMTLDGVRFTLDGGRHDATKAWNVSAIVDIDGVTDIHTGAKRIETGHDLPETVMALLPGRPLRDVLSHPLLDAADLTIDDAHAIGAGTRIYHRRKRDLRIGDVQVPRCADRERICAPDMRK